MKGLHLFGLVDVRDIILILSMSIFIFTILFLFSPYLFSGLPDALTCESMDQFLEDDMLGKIKLTEGDKQMLLEGMNWCMEKGYQVKPLSHD